MLINLSSLDIYEVENFSIILLENLKEFNDEIYSLDFSKVKKIDLCGIQLLISLKKYCDEQNITLKLNNINSEQITTSLNTYNLNSILGID